jgi:hypothetical protein
MVIHLDSRNRQEHPSIRIRGLPDCDSLLIVPHLDSFVKRCLLLRLSVLVPAVAAGSLRCLRGNEGYYAIRLIPCQVVFDQFL